MHFKITDNGILGEIDFEIEEESISVSQIYVSQKRCSMGTKLVKKLEGFALEKNLNIVTVPAAPSIGALSFWIKMGYNFVFREDKELAKQILNSSSSNTEEIFNTGSGIILLSKKIE